MSDSLFPPPPAERLAAVARFVTDEREQRAFMLKQHPDQEAYWLRRLFAAEQALMHLDALAMMLSGLDAVDVRL